LRDAALLDGSFGAPNFYLAPCLAEKLAPARPCVRRQQTLEAVQDLLERHLAASRQLQALTRAASGQK